MWCENSYGILKLWFRQEKSTKGEIIGLQRPPPSSQRKKSSLLSTPKVSPGRLARPELQKRPHLFSLPSQSLWLQFLAVFREQLSLVSMWVFLSHWPLTALEFYPAYFPCYRMISPSFSSLYQNFYVGWKHFRWLRQWLPHSSYVENTPGSRNEGIGESNMERKERWCGVGPELVPASHLTTLTDNPSSAHLASYGLKFLIQYDCFPLWTPSFLREERSFLYYALPMC